MFEWLRNLAGQIGNVKDGLADPVNTSGEVVKDIVSKLNPALQRIVVIALILAAMIMGADMGIQYQKSQMMNLPSIEEVKPTAPESPTSFNPPPAESMKTIEVWKPTLEPFTLPGVKPANPTKPRPVARPSRGENAKAAERPRQRAAQAKKRPAGSRHLAKPNRPVRSTVGRRKGNNYNVWKGLPLREMRSSGPGGY